MTGPPGAGKSEVASYLHDILGDEGVDAALIEVRRARALLPGARRERSISHLRMLAASYREVGSELLLITATLEDDEYRLAARSRRRRRSSARPAPGRSRDDAGAAAEPRAAGLVGPAGAAQRLAPAGGVDAGPRMGSTSRSAPTAASRARWPPAAGRAAPPLGRRSGPVKAVRVGCAGWAYQDWRGVLYPERMPQREWLAAYAREFSTVEINNTFYRLPSEAAVEGWVGGDAGRLPLRGQGEPLRHPRQAPAEAGDLRRAVPSSIEPLRARASSASSSGSCRRASSATTIASTRR